MAVIAIVENESTNSTLVPDGLSALEQKIVRTVELLNSERQARAQAEHELQALRTRVEQEQSGARELESELKALRQERDTVRTRVEKLMKQLDALADA